MTIEELDLSVRAYHALTNAGVTSVSQLTRLSEGEVLEIPNIGKLTLNEIKEVLGERGMHLGMPQLDRFFVQHVEEGLAVREGWYVVEGETPIALCCSGRSANLVADALNQRGEK